MRLLVVHPAHDVARQTADEQLEFPLALRGPALRRETLLEFALSRSGICHVREMLNHCDAVGIDEMQFALIGREIQQLHLGPSAVALEHPDHAVTVAGVFSSEVSSPRSAQVVSATTLAPRSR
jgi:hypothetical protein